MAVNITTSMRTGFLSMTFAVTFFLYNNPYSENIFFSFVLVYYFTGRYLFEVFAIPIIINYIYVDDARYTRLLSCTGIYRIFTDGIKKWNGTFRYPNVFGSYTERKLVVLFFIFERDLSKKILIKNINGLFFFSTESKIRIHSVKSAYQHRNGLQLCVFNAFSTPRICSQAKNVITIATPSSSGM